MRSVKSRSVRLISVLFGLSLLLSACDLGDVLELADAQAPAPQEAPDAPPADQKPDPAAPNPEPDSPKPDPAAPNPEPAPKPKPTPSAPKPAAPKPASPSADDAALSAIEQEIYGLLNAQRAKAGLSALKVDADMSKGSRDWSCKMGKAKTLEHANLRSAGVNGENIAYGQRDAAQVTKGWNESPGHYRNRMSANWSEYGVGVCDVGGTLWYTERFR